MAFNTQEIRWPPALQSLNFSSNCSLVAAFFQSWFDIESEPLVKFDDSKVNASLWIPSSLSENATEAYFRNALPQDLQAVTSASDILAWEYEIRFAFAETIAGFNLSNTAVPLKAPYFDFVIDRPARICRNSTCTIGVDSDKLADLNGPGMHLFVGFQAVVLLFYSLVVLLEGCHVLRGHDPKDPPPKRWPRPGSLLHAVYESVKDAFDGLSDTIGVFNLALPVAVCVQYALAKGLKLVFRKDFLLAGWIVACSLAASLWTWRIAACLRRIESQLESNFSNGTHPFLRTRHRKGTLIISMLLGFSAALILLGSIYIFIRFTRPPFRLEEYSDNICNFGYSLTGKNLLAVLGAMAGYAVFRCAISTILRWCIGREKQKDWERQHKSANNKDKSIFKRKLKSLKRNDPQYRRNVDFWACVDLILFGACTITLLVFYEIYRFQLLKILGKNWIKDGWNLGQVLSVSTILPVAIGYLRGLSK
ncbi:hypothetical protein BKA64DRAFT_708935 [Cadophora sp. MPI-SDFR-AT-0126]|nr:hypothetical protein BKA64DRAFT_708935 [Leotiomycetes sp. MPI-SDFR-AT-0126]